MSTLSRFRKPGGFQQLLLLIETSEPSKQKLLIQMVAKEDPGWAHLLKVKALTFERVLSWPQEVLMEITAPLPDPILMAAYLLAEYISLEKNQRLQDKWLQALPNVKAKEISEMAKLFSGTPSELSAAGIRVLQTVRDLESKGHLRLLSFDPTLELDERITAA